MGPKFIAKVEEVKRLLADAEGYYQAGRYDLAHKKYEQVLALDPYNTAARRGEERLDNAKYKYGARAPAFAAAEGVGTAGASIWAEHDRGLQLDRHECQ